MPFSAHTTNNKFRVLWSLWALMVLRIFGYVTLLLVVLMPAHKAEATEGRAVVAVATNFLSTADALAKDFNHRFDLNISLVSGSSGKLYAQIRYGAPFDVFLSADLAFRLNQ